MNSGWTFVLVFRVSKKFQTVFFRRNKPLETVQNKCLDIELLASRAILGWTAQIEGRWCSPTLFVFCKLWCGTFKAAVVWWLWKSPFWKKYQAQNVSCPFWVAFHSSFVSKLESLSKNQNAQMAWWIKKAIASVTSLISMLLNTQNNKIRCLCTNSSWENLSNPDVFP